MMCHTLLKHYNQKRLDNLIKASVNSLNIWLALLMVQDYLIRVTYRPATKAFPQTAVKNVEGPSK